MRDCSWIPGKFPNLAGAGFNIQNDCTSDRTHGHPVKYNCIAWAAGITNEWWWPWKLGGYTWPKGDGLCFELPKQETLGNFIAAFRSIGYDECDNGIAEDGFEKVAIYVDPQGRPTHAARSIPSGGWTSKLGDCEDIRHPTLESIECITYGTATAFLKRKIESA